MTGVTAIEGKERGLVRLPEFVAVTLNVYALPFVKPVTVADLAFIEAPVTSTDVPDISPKYGIIVYFVIEVAPIVLGAFHVTVADAFPATAVIPVGAEGGVTGATGITTFDETEGTLVSCEFSTVTLNVYAIPFVKPITVAVLLAALFISPPVTSTSSTPVSTAFDLYVVTMYLIIAELPCAEIVQLTIADSFPAIAETVAGAVGATIGIGKKLLTTLLGSLSLLRPSEKLFVVS